MQILSIFLVGLLLFVVISVLMYRADDSRTIGPWNMKDDRKPHWPSKQRHDVRICQAVNMTKHGKLDLHRIIYRIS